MECEGLLPFQNTLRVLFVSAPQPTSQRGFLTRFLYGKRPYLGVRNCVCCETHREAIETIFYHQML